MTTNASDTNNSDNKKDNDGFIDEPPYCFGWMTNAKGIKVPVFPYVISILGHLDLKELGIPDDNINNSTKLLENTLAVYLEQIIKRWEKRYFWQKKIDIPLIILINFADKIGELITDVVEKLQEKYPFVRLIAVLPMPKNELINQLKAEGETDENINAFINRYDDFNKNENGKNQKYIWELSEREIPLEARQTKLERWRMFNEFVAQHSHIMIAFWQGDQDTGSGLDDSLTWAIRYKLEGYPGLSRNEQTDWLTYPATGPVLHIQTDSETLQTSKEFLPVRYYPERTNITEEVDGKRKLIIANYEFWDLEKRRHSWLGRRFSDIWDRPEINNNFEILKKLNYACQDKNASQDSKPLNNPPLSSIIEKDIIGKRPKNKKTIDIADFPEVDQPTGQFLAHYSIVKQLSEYYKRKTYGLASLFCLFFLMLFWFSIALFFLSNVCSMKNDVNIYRLSHYYVSHWIPNQDLPINAYYWEQLFVPVKQFIPQTSQDPKLDDLINNNTQGVSNIVGLSLLCSVLIIVFLISVSACYISSSWNSWHYKYHQLKTLEDCLNVQVYWKVAGLDSRICTNFYYNQTHAIDWLLMALNGINATIPNSRLIESTSKLKERLRIVDDIWIEKNIHGFNNIIRTKLFKFIWSHLKLTNFSNRKSEKFTVREGLAFFAVMLPILSTILVLFTQPPMWATISCVLILFALFYPFLYVLWHTIIRKWLEKRLQWAEDASNKSGFLRYIYQHKIKQKDESKRYFQTPSPRKLFSLYLIILIVCVSVFFDIYADSQNPVFKNALFNPWVAIGSIIQISLSNMAIWYLFCRMGLFAKSRARIEKLYYPFNRAHYLVSTFLTDENAVETINANNNSPKSKNANENKPSDEQRVKLCQQVILKLGEAVLAKRAGWLLAYTDRNMQSPK